MNERIKEFAFEARLITVDGITRYASDYEFEKRFAELIVRECAELCDVNDKEQGDILREHFGVKK